MSKDISNILAGWDHVPDEVSVRIVQGDDGREKLQMRLELGLMQMEMDGRPDGQRPEGRDSWLDLFEQQQAEFAARGDADDFHLNAEQCGQLLREGIQYYHRYLSFWNLRRFDLCARDTARNLRLFAFVRQHARRERDRLQFDQWRPYVTMMHARAVATPLLEAGNVQGGLAKIDEGIESIRAFLEEYRQSHRSQQCSELNFLLRWRSEVAEQAAQAERPRPTTLERLQGQLADAVALEDFERAAELRDEIRRQTQGPPAPLSEP